MTNAFAFIETKPEKLNNPEHGDIVGDKNDAHIKAAQEKSEITVLCWGNSIDSLGNKEAERLAELKSILTKPVFCIRKTGDGNPGHPNPWKPFEPTKEPIEFVF